MHKSTRGGGKNCVTKRKSSPSSTPSTTPKPTRRASLSGKTSSLNISTPEQSPHHSSSITSANNHGPLHHQQRSFAGQRRPGKNDGVRNIKPKQYDESMRLSAKRGGIVNPEEDPNPYQSPLQQFSHDHYSEHSQDEAFGKETIETDMFFQQKDLDPKKTRQEMHKKQETNSRLHALKGFLGADPTQYGISKKTQQQIGQQMMQQFEDDQKLDAMDDREIANLSREKTLFEQSKDFDQMPVERYLEQAMGHRDGAELLRDFRQHDLAKSRFQKRQNDLMGLTEGLEAQAQKQQQKKKRVQFDEYGNEIDITHPKYNHDLDLNDEDGDEGSYEEEEVEVSGEELKALLSKFKPTVGPNGELIFDEASFLNDGEASPLGSGQDTINLDDIAVDELNPPTALKKLKNQQHSQAELQQSFDQYQQALADDPSVFKYVDDDYEYFIPPGMSLPKLIEMDLPVETLLNYVRKQIAEGQVQTNYMGVSLQQLMKRMQLENIKRKQKGLPALELTEFKATTLKDIDTKNLPTQDVRDLEEYYNHFEQFRRLKAFEKMKDHPAFDENDPDWVEDGDGDDEKQISKTDLKKLSKVDPKLAKLLKKQDGTIFKIEEIDSNEGGRFTAEQRAKILKKYGKPTFEDFANDQNNDDLTFGADDDEYRREMKHREQLESGNAFERELQYPDHKPTIRALQNFVRTVPMDEPIPKELQRRVNLLLNDADYRKLKDYHYMMNDVEIWYLANRMPVVYSIMRRVLIEIRQRIPTWKPERVLEFAAGASPALWAVRDIYYQDIAEYTAVERDGRLALLGQQLTADLGVHIYYRSRLLVNDDGQMEVSKDDDLKREKKRAKLTHKQKKLMDKEDKLRKERQLVEMGKKHTLVFSPYALSKQPNKEYRRLLLEALWDQVDPNGGLLVIIESTEADASGFNVVRECRDYLLKKYPKTSLQQEHIVDTTSVKANDADVITPIVQVEDNLEQNGGDPEGANVPEWAQGATKKVTTEEQSARTAKPKDPSASSILPCSHDRPCPMGAMLKLNEEVKKLKTLAKEEQLAISLPQVPIKSCMFGQRMLRAPMPNQSPLQDLEIPQFLGDAIIENFSYIVLRRGEIPTVKEDDLTMTPYESSILPKNKVNLPGGMTREEYVELKKWEREQMALEEDQENQKMQEQYEEDLAAMSSAKAHQSRLNKNSKNSKNQNQNNDQLKKPTLQQTEAERLRAEQAELGDFIDDDEDGGLEYDLLAANNDDEGVANMNNLNEIEARRLAMSVFGTKSIDNEESLERHTENLIGKLSGAVKHGSPTHQQMLEKEKEQEGQEPVNLYKKQPAKLANKYDQINDMMTKDDEIDPSHVNPLEPAEPVRDILEDYDLDVIQKELGYELDEEALQTLREVIMESERDRPLLNPKKEFNLNRWSRVLSPPLKRGGHVLMDLCTPDGNFERRIVGREGVGALGFKQARLMNWGDVWPYKRPMTLKELKIEREMELNGGFDSNGSTVGSSQQAKETLKELRDLFSVNYTADTIKTIDHYSSRLKTKHVASDDDEDSTEGDDYGDKDLKRLKEFQKLDRQNQLKEQKLIAQAAKEFSKNQLNPVKVPLDQLNFDNMDDDFNPELLSQLGELRAVREHHEERFKKNKREQRQDNTPTSVIESNLLNDPNFYDVNFDEDADDKFQAELRAHKLLEDLKTLSPEQQELLGPDVKAAIGVLKGKSTGTKEDQYLEQLEREAMMSAGGSTTARPRRNGPKNALSPQEMAKLPLIEQLRLKKEEDDYHRNKQLMKEFADDLTDYSEDNGLPEGFDDLTRNTTTPQTTAVPTRLSKGVKVEDVITNVERKINAIKEDRKERSKMSKKQQKIAEKQAQKDLEEQQKLELIALGYDPGSPKFKQALKALYQGNMLDEEEEGEGEEKPTPSGNIQEDFAKLLGKNVEFDDSIASYQQTRQRQEQELKELREERKTTKGGDDDDDDFSYDEQNDGPSDYSDGEILRVPGEKDTVPSSFDPSPADFQEKDFNFEKAKSNEWLGGTSKENRQALRARLFDVMSHQNTDELRSFIDDPTLGTSSSRKQKEERKEVKRKGQGGDNLTRAERQKRDQMKKEFLFSDDDEWDLNELDGIKSIPLGNIGTTLGEDNNPDQGKKKSKEVHTIQGAALDIVDHSYRVLSTGTKAKLGVPLTGKRSFAENLDLLEKEGDDEIKYVEVAAQKQRQQDIFGFKKGSSSNSKNGPGRPGNNGPKRNGPRTGGRRYSTVAHKNNTFGIVHNNSSTPLSTQTSSYTTHSQSYTTVPQKSAVLLTMQGTAAPKKSSAKVVQIGTGLNHQKLYPNRQVSHAALGIDPRGPAIHPTSMYNTILTPRPTADLTANERTVDIEESAATALSRNNRDQAENIAVHGFFQYDGGLPMGAYSMARSQDMARKLQGLAGIGAAQGPEMAFHEPLDAPEVRPTPGRASPFKDNSAPPMDMGHGPEAINAQATRQVFGHDIYVHETDPLQRHFNKPHLDEVSGMLQREKPAKGVDLIQKELDVDPEGDELETYTRDIYVNALDKAQSRQDEFGNDYAGKVHGDSPGSGVMDHFKSEGDMKRKLESRKKRAEFGMRIDHARQRAAKLLDQEYIPNTPTSVGMGKKNVSQIDLSSANLGKAPEDSGQLFYKERISAIQNEIDQVKKLRRDRQRKMLTPLALSDELPRDPEGNLLETIKAQPSVHAKTATEKRASLAVIEQPDEYELRKLREEKGMDYSYTALMTNVDGFGPKMDADGRMPQKKILTPFDQDLITLGELENLAKHSSDELRPQLAHAVNQAHQALMYDKNLQNTFQEQILQGRLRDVPFKLKLTPKAANPNDPPLQIGTNSTKPKKETFDYEIKPLSPQDVALMKAEQAKIITQPDLRRDVEKMLVQHQTGLTFKQRQDILAQDHDQQVKVSLQTQQLGQLARRFTQMAQKQEDRDLLRGDSEEEYSFQPPDVPSLQSSWGVKNRTPERHQTSTIATDHFVKQQRKFDKLVAEVQEVDLLEKLIDKSIKVPEGIKNTSKSPYHELEDSRAKELLIKKGIKTRAQIELEELQEALAFERSMQQAVDATYGEAKQTLKKKLQHLARQDSITPKQFNMDIKQGLLEGPSKAEREQQEAEMLRLNDPNTFVRNKSKKLAAAQQKLLLQDHNQQQRELAQGAYKNENTYHEAEVIPSTSNSKRQHGKRNQRM